SQSYKNGHIPNSLWLSRSWLEFYIHDAVNESASIVLICQNGLTSTLSAVTLKDLGFEHVFVLENGKKSWSEANFSFDYGSEGFIHEANDIAFPPYDRGKKAMVEYLEWEIDLESKMELLK